MKFLQYPKIFSLLKNQWVSPSNLAEIQNRKLRKLIQHAYEKVPYYRELFDSAKIKPEDIRSIDDLRAIPITTKSQLQQLSLKEKTANNIDLKKCKIIATSGTTGVPLKIFYTPEDFTLINLSWARAFLSSGIKPWYKMIAFIGQKNTKKGKRWYEYFGIWRREEISTWDPPKKWIEKIIEWKPHVLIGYAINLKLLEEALREYEIKFIPKIIFHSSGILDDSMRSYLELFFKTRIVDIYGSDEGGCIAWECKKCKGYHICSDMVVVEILKNGKYVSPGEEGEVIITNLHSYAMPFIRYKQEDIVFLSKRKSICGRNFPLLEQILGRIDDFVILRNGRKIPPQPIYHCIVSFPEVKRWRAIQENIDTIVVELEPGKDFSLEIKNAIQNNLMELLGEDIKVEIKIKDSIPVLPNTKFRTVSSRIIRNTIY